MQGEEEPAVGSQEGDGEVNEMNEPDTLESTNDSRCYMPEMRLIYSLVIVSLYCGF